MSGHPAGCPWVHYSHGYAGYGSQVQAILGIRGVQNRVLRAQVDASHREDWIFELKGPAIEVLKTYPDLVRTGLDLLNWPTVVFLHSGYSVYTLTASRPAILAYRAEGTG